MTKNYRIIVKGKKVDIDYATDEEGMARSFLLTIIKDMTLEDIKIYVTGPPPDRSYGLLDMSSMSSITFDTTGTGGLTVDADVDTGSTI